MSDPNESSHYAFHELVLLARADRELRAPEQRVLDRFAAHLGISARKTKHYLRVCKRRARDFPQDPQRQLDLLKMLARVAYSDGTMQDEERRFFEQLSNDFSIPRTRLAHVLEEAEAKAHRHVHLDRRWLCAALVAVAITGTLGWIWAHNQPDEMTGFKELDDTIRPTLLLVHTRFTLHHPTQPPRRLSATGTGFFVSRDGLAITNKHVVQPWRFLGKAVDLIAQGYTVAAEDVDTLAWREGVRALDQNDLPHHRTAFKTSDGTLQLVSMAPDAELAANKRPSHLRVGNVFVHANDNGDLAVLRCAIQARVAPAPLAVRSSDVRRLDPIMVLGYPRGLHLLESARAVSSPSVGRVRKVEDTIYVTAPVVGGNSGGPLIDRSGQIIGIATRTSGAATLACCLRVEHVQTLVSRVR